MNYSTNPCHFPTLRQTAYLLLCICCLVPVNGYSQLLTLKQVQENRFAAQTYLQKEKYDSARIAISRFVAHEIYATPYDYLNFALCHYQQKDTAAFLKYLNSAIEGGIDSTKIKSILSKPAGPDKLFLNSYLSSHYEQERQKGWLKYDTALIKEANAIADLDQLGRNELMRLKAGKADSNYSYLLFLQKQADSVNYTRVARLLASGRFPGYRNCGAFASLTIMLLHSGDYHEAQWEYLFSHLKEEVAAGNILPVEVATIADNHYQRGDRKLCSYYGQWTGRTTELCNCKEVDNYRAVIGLQNLQTEYTAKKKAIPECYTPTGQQ